MKQENNCALPQEGAFRTTIGGQALIEGILMRGPENRPLWCATRRENWRSRSKP